MRFMMLLKSDANTEAGVMPSAEILTAMGKYNQELFDSGKLIAGEGLQPSSKGFRIRNRGGNLTITDGPFPETHELLAGYWMIKADSKEEAIEWAKRVPFESGGPSATGDGTGQIEIRQVFELDDFPVNENESGWREQEAELREKSGNGSLGAAADAGAGGANKLKYLMMFKADERSEAGVLPSEEELATMGALMGELAEKGIIVEGEGLQPSSKGARVYFSNGKRTVVDGPFPETKELMAGYCVVQVDSREEALEIAKRGALAGGDCDCEIRQVFQTSDFPAELVAEVPEVFEAEREMRGGKG
jgi:hypothetical protein